MENRTHKPQIDHKTEKISSFAARHTPKLRHHFLQSLIAQV
ncbi:hypothetical protein [Hugenholtzia roseola]|nr:hypothetical protein [Hugenholtzia roseola]